MDKIIKDIDNYVIGMEKIGINVDHIDFDCYLDYGTLCNIYLLDYRSLREVSSKYGVEIKKGCGRAAVHLDNGISFVYGEEF